MNCIILSGRLVKDPEVRYTQSGKIVATFALAVNRPFAKEEAEANFEADIKRLKEVFYVRE